MSNRLLTSEKKTLLLSLSSRRKNGWRSGFQVWIWIKTNEPVILPKTTLLSKESVPAFLPGGTGICFCWRRQWLLSGRRRGIGIPIISLFDGTLLAS
jgi:hypothetical protein